MKNQFPQPGDVDYGVFTHITQWDNTMKCVPSFQALFEVEYIRQSGIINMITEDLVGELYKRSMMDGRKWILTCRRANIFWGSVYESTIKYYESVHGLKTLWYTEEFRTEIALREIEFEKRLLLLKLKKLNTKECKA
jgi:hypothetical protein